MVEFPVAVKCVDIGRNTSGAGPPGPILTLRCESVGANMIRYPELVHAVNDVDAAMGILEILVAQLTR